MARWFRWYDGTTEDGKFRVVARKSRVTVSDVIALWAFILEDASNVEHRGVCHRDEDFMASILDFEDGVVESILSAMQSVGMISVGSGAITICNWGKRQFESDTDPTAPERQRRKRGRESRVTDEDVTRDSRPPDTDSDTDSDTESDSESDSEGGGTRALTQEPATRQEATEIVAEIAGIAGLDPKHPLPAWRGAARDVEIWLARGWRREVIVLAVRSVMTRKRDGPPESIRYFEKAIARAHRQPERQLPLMSVVSKNSGGNDAGQRPATSVHAAIRGLRERSQAVLAEFDAREGGTSGLRDQAGGADVRLLQEGRGQ